MYYLVPVPVPVPIPTTDDMHHHLITYLTLHVPSRTRRALSLQPESLFPTLRPLCSRSSSSSSSSIFLIPIPSHPYSNYCSLPQTETHLFYIDCTKYMYLHIHTIIYKKSYLSSKRPPYPPPSKKTTRPHPPVAPRRASMLARLACKLLLLQYTTLPGLTLGWGAGCMHGKLKKRYMYIVAANRHCYIQVYTSF